MNARERFVATLHFGPVDRFPFHDDEVRAETIERWRREGMPEGSDLCQLFGLERWETVPLDLGMVPKFRGRLRSRRDFRRLRESYDHQEASRYPGNWDDLVRGWGERDYPLGIDAWPGFLRPLNVSGPASLRDLIRLMYLDPEIVEEMTVFIAEFSIQVTERALREVEIDYAVMREPIAENRGPVIPPSLFDRFVIPCYRRIAKELRRQGIDVIIFSTSGNVSSLIRLCLEAGVNCLRCGGTGRAGIDYVSLRREYGRRLLLIGGIDVETLARGRQAIRTEIMSKVPYLLDSGGYIPMVDNRVRDDVPYENYAYYRDLLRTLVMEEAR